MTPEIISTEHHGKLVCEEEFNDDCRCNRCYYCNLAYDLHAPTYMRMFSRGKYRAIVADTPYPETFVLEHHPVKFDPAEFEYQPYPQEIAQKYFYKPCFSEEKLEEQQELNTSLFTQNLPQAVLWAVTGGRICADKNKRLYYLYTKTTAPLTPEEVACLQDKRSSSMWRKLCDETDTNFEFLYAITTACQDLHDHLVSEFNRYRTHRKSRRLNTVFTNINDMPSYKTFRKCISKDFDHNKYRWRFTPRQLGGNNGLSKPPEPVRVKIPCVHKMLQNYKGWLPVFRKRTKKQVKLEMMV